MVDLIKALKQTGPQAICYLDPNEADVAPRLAEICKNAKVCFATQWNIPDAVRPWHFDPYWVVHSTPDSEQEGYRTARALCMGMNGRGTLLALQGRLGNSSGQGRYKGMMQAVAEFPDIELFHAYVNDWGRVKSMKATERWLQHLPQIDGVWAACDEMALGALEVFRAAGKAGKVKITGIDATGDAVKAVIAGEMLCTASPDPYWQAGMSLSFAYQAYRGNLSVTGIPQGKRACYITTQLIDQENAEKYLADYVNGMPTYNYLDLWQGKWLAPIGPATTGVTIPENDQ